MEELYDKACDLVNSWEAHLADPIGTVIPLISLTRVDAKIGLFLARQIYNKSYKKKEERRLKTVLTDIDTSAGPDNGIQRSRSQTGRIVSDSRLYRFFRTF